jgi:hypothetical protein
VIGRSSSRPYPFCVAQTAEKVKSKLEGMLQAKKQLDPLWGRLSQPLLQILAGVGLLMEGAS